MTIARSLLCCAPNALICREVLSFRVVSRPFCCTMMLVLCSGACTDYPAICFTALPSAHYIFTHCRFQPLHPVMSPDAVSQAQAIAPGISLNCTEHSWGASFGSYVHSTVGHKQPASASGWQKQADYNEAYFRFVLLGINARKRQHQRNYTLPVGLKSRRNFDLSFA